MTHRRPDSAPRDLEDVLRRALLTAADSIDPAADGLDRIRAKISVRRRAGFSLRMADLARAGSARIGGTQLRYLRPVGVWILVALSAVGDRFRPHPNSSGRYGWLRPAAALATGIFVVVAGSWAASTLPQAVAPTADQGTGPGALRVSPPSTRPAKSSGHPGTVPGSTGPSRSASGSPSCGPDTSRGGMSPPLSPSTSPTPSPSSSPTPSSSPSPSQSTSGSPTSSPSPSSSASDISPSGPGPISTGPPNADVVPHSNVVLSSDVVPSSDVVHPATPSPSASATPQPSASPPQCGG